MKFIPIDDESQAKILVYLLFILSSPSITLVFFFIFVIQVIYHFLLEFEVSLSYVNQQVESLKPRFIKYCSFLSTTF